jgi:hypothetical protein
VKNVLGENPPLSPPLKRWGKRGWLSPYFSGGTESLSRNNTIPDEVGGGEAEETVIGSRSFLEACQEFAISVHPTMAGLHDPTVPFVRGIMSAKVEILTKAEHLGDVTALDHGVVSLIAPVAAIRAQHG